MAPQEPPLDVTELKYKLASHYRAAGGVGQGRPANYHALGVEVGYTHSNLLKHPRTLEFNPRIHMIGYISVAVDSLVPERVPSSSRTPGYEATLLTVK